MTEAEIRENRSHAKLFRFDFPKRSRPPLFDYADSLLWTLMTARYGPISSHRQPRLMPSGDDLPRPDGIGPVDVEPGPIIAPATPFWARLVGRASLARRGVSSDHADEETD